jgi:hypothetical protein
MIASESINKFINRKMEFNEFMKKIKYLNLNKQLNSFFTDSDIKDIFLPNITMEK